MNVLAELQSWYESQCDGDWEHDYGIKISNLDNLGWEVNIDLIGTRLDSKNFDDVEINNSEDNWLYCKNVEDKFIGYCSPQNLEQILRIFIEWSRE